MSADPIDDLAERLFASARGERAGERLLQRVLTDVATPDERPRQLSRRSGPARARARPLPRLLIAAAACIVAGVTWSTLEPVQAPPISAEVAPRGEHAPGVADRMDTPHSPTPAVTSAPPAATNAPDPESVPHAETPRAPDEPTSTPPRRPASRRPPHGTPARTAATPPVVAPSAEPAPAPAAPGTTGAVAPDVQDAIVVPAAPPSLSHELQALERARAALRGGDGRAALRLLDADDEGAGFTRLADEATLLRIEALYAVGELAESRRLAEEFTTQNPDSHLGDRARSFIHRVDSRRNAAGVSAPR